MDDQDLLSEQDEIFDQQWAEWISTQPHFTQKGELFIQTFKMICKSWYLRGIKAGIICGALMVVDVE